MQCKSKSTRWYQYIAADSWNACKVHTKTRKKIGRKSKQSARWKKAARDSNKQKDPSISIGEKWRRAQHDRGCCHKRFWVDAKVESSLHAHCIVVVFFFLFLIGSVKWLGDGWNLSMCLHRHFASLFCLVHISVPRGRWTWHQLELGCIRWCRCYFKLFDLIWVTTTGDVILIVEQGLVK